MAAFVIAHALVPAFCEEAIRSSYLFFLGERGSRRGVVLSLSCVFVFGELFYDLSLFPSAAEELGTVLAAWLLALAVASGTLLHLGLTGFTASRQKNGASVWRVFGIALAIHASFNLAAIFFLGLLL